MTTHGIGKWYVEIEKQAFWRGAPKNWVNRYVFTNSDPTGADATSVINALKAIENLIHPLTSPHLGVGFVEGRAYSVIGGSPFQRVEYNAGSGAATATGFAGTSASGSTQAWAPTLETCLLIETPLLLKSSSGKPVSLKKYYRGVSYGSPEDSAGAEIGAGDLAQIAAEVLPLFTGLGGTPYVVQGVGSNPVGVTPPFARPYLVNHQIPRGKKKKKVTLTEGSSDILLKSLIEGALATAGAALV